MRNLLIILVLFTACSKEPQCIDVNGKWKIAETWDNGELTYQANDSVYEYFVIQDTTVSKYSHNKTDSLIYTTRLYCAYIVLKSVNEWYYGYGMYGYPFNYRVLKRL